MKMWYLMVAKKKNPLVIWRWDRKIHPSESPFVITGQASWCETVILGTDFPIPPSHSWWDLIIHCFWTPVNFINTTVNFTIFIFGYWQYFHYFSRETYNALTNWLTDARTLASPNIVIILVGNKKDLEAEREVTFLEASRFAQENGK